jgi:hypothetical protein
MGMNSIEGRLPIEAQVLFLHGRVWPVGGSVNSLFLFHFVPKMSKETPR